MTGTATGFLPLHLISGPDDAIQFMEEHLFPIAEGVGEGSPKARRGENWKLISQFQTQSTSAHLVHFSA
jgi:hypothetical protein